MMREATLAGPAQSAAHPLASRTAGTAQHPLLALQQAAGNRAVARMVAAAGKLPPGVKPEDGDVQVGGLLARNGDGATALATPSPAPAAGVTPPSPGPPPMLSKKVISGPTPTDCGGFKWVVQWKLSKPTTIGGWVVQRVDATRNVTDAKGAAAPVNNGWDPAWTPYWEGWQINAGQSVTTYAETGDLEDDTYAGSAGGPDTKGTFTMTGHAQFYEAATLPATMKPTNSAPAWILPFTNTDPKLGGGTGSIPHDLTATWDCTGADKSTKITTK